MSDPNTTILVVDDEPLILDLVENALTEAGFAVRTAISADEAIEILEHPEGDQVAGLVSDVNLGDRSGWSVATRARELEPTIPVVYVTGDSAHEWDSRGAPRSMVIGKPFAPAQIVIAIATLLNDVGADRGA
ncbi:MAG: response regulator [Pseudomonadota bacterium]